MKKLKAFSILLIFISCASISSQELNKYAYIKMGHIDTGDSFGEIGYAIFPEGPAIPKTFTIDSNMKVYIPDPINNRLNIFNIDLEYLKTIKEKKDGELAWTSLLKIDSDGNIIYIETSIGLRKIDQDGNEIFTIRPQLLDKQVKYSGNIHLIENSIFFYNENNKPVTISDQGIIESEKKAVNILKNLSGLNYTRLYSYNGKQLPNTAIQKIKNIQAEGNYIIVGNKFYSTIFNQHQEYYSQIADTREQITTLNSHNSSIQEERKNIKKPNSIDIDAYYQFFTGYDEDHNSYWIFESKNDKATEFKKLIVIFNPFGELLDAFQYGVYYNYKPDLSEYPLTRSIVTIAPNGDVWFMQGSAEQYTFYKVERQW